MQERIRLFVADDIDFALAQTAREGWDSTTALFEVALGHDPQGCSVAEAAGRVVGMITTTRYERTAWVGNLIVVPEYRRRGLGERLMNHALEHIASHGIRSVQLEADPMGIGIYRRLGFSDAFQSLRFRSDPPHAPVQDAHGARLADGDWNELLQLDSAAFGDDRHRLLVGLVARGISCSVVRTGGRLQGYALVFPSTDGVHLGPWVATDPAVAERLLDNVLHACPDDAVIVGSPDVNPHAKPILQARGFREQQPCLRMVRGVPIDSGRSDQLYAIANGAMG